MRKSSKKGCTDHDGAGACFFGDAGLFGIDDVHCAVNVSSQRTRTVAATKFCGGNVQPARFDSLMTPPLSI